MAYFRHQNTYKDADLNEIAKYSQSWYNYFNTSQFYENSMFYRDTATLLYFNYKTTHSFVYKRKKLADGSYKTVEKDDQFNPPQEMMEEGKFEKVEKRIDVWYTGVMVMGTNIVLEWKLAENMVRPKSANQFARPNYVACAPRMYKGRIDSLVNRITGFADMIQLTHLKIQQVLSRVVPDGVYLDMDGLAEVDLGNGTNYNPAEALNMYFQTGSIVGRSMTQDGDMNPGKIPIQELNSNNGMAKIQSLIQTYQYYLQMIRDVTGLNEARDGSDPDKHSLVGLQKMAANASNTATKHILNAALYLTLRTCENISLRVADMLQFDLTNDSLLGTIGKFNVATLEEIQKLHL